MKQSSRALAQALFILSALTMLQPRVSLRHILPLRNLPYISRRTFAEALDHIPPSPLSASNLPPPSSPDSSLPTNPYDSTTRPEDTPEPPFALRSYKPRTPGVRHLRRPINDHLYKGRAYLPLTFARKGQHIGGRNNSGQIRVRHRGGGHKRRIRMIDFHRAAPGRHTVERIEYDPGRSAHIALLTHNETHEKSYIVAAQGMRAGETVESFLQGVPELLLQSLGGSRDAGMIAAKTAWRGNCLPLHMIPTGTLVFCVGLRKGGKAQLCRSAGTFAMVIGRPGDVERKKVGENGPLEDIGAGGTEKTEELVVEKEAGKKLDKEDMYVAVRLKSGEVRKIHREACATIGTASNTNYNRRQLGKAGRSRWLGIRPSVRGVAMNASDHPHGGGRGKSKGNVQPVSIWGQLVSKSALRRCLFERCFFFFLVFSFLLPPLQPNNDPCFTNFFFSHTDERRLQDSEEEQRQPRGDPGETEEYRPEVEAEEEGEAVQVEELRRMCTLLPASCQRGETVAVLHIYIYIHMHVHIYLSIQPASDAWTETLSALKCLFACLLNKILENPSCTMHGQKIEEVV